MSSVETNHLKALGSDTDYKYKGADANLLERFDSPFTQEQFKTKGFSTATVFITCPEFTSLCPMTGQPDFATIEIEYTPAAYCVESKSLKLYLGSFRNMGEFHESCVARIAKDLVDLLQPDDLRVKGKFTPRGGIPFWPEVMYYAPPREVSATEDPLELPQIAPC